jgi:HEAT repeat protein
MSGVSCWFDNQDLIEGNTFAANKREALAVLGASKPKVRGNIFWQNPTAVSEGKINNDAKDAKGAALLENNVFWMNEKNRPDGEKDDLPTESKSILADPGFANVEKNDFGLTDSVAKKAGAGVLQPLALTSPWPLLPEEKLLIPDGPSRDSNAWKKADGQTQPAANTQQRLVTLHKSVAPIVKDALQIDDAEKRLAAVEKIRSKIQSKSDEEAAAGLVAYQGIGPVKFDKKSFREALLSKLASEDPFVRSRAVSSLSGDAGERSDLERILKLAKDDDTEVRNAVGWSLIWLTQKDLSGPEGDRWVEILETGNAGFRKGMIHGLWGVKTQTALQEKLVAMSKEPGELAYDCLYYALSTSPNKGEACVGRLIEYLADPDSTNIAGRASWGLGYGVVPEQEGKVADAMIKLYTAREDGYLRKNALTSLSNYAHEQHVPQLEAIMAKPGISDDDKKRIVEVIEAAKQRK